MAISKSEILDEIKSQHKDKSDFFSKLAACSEISGFLIGDSKTSSDQPFPPSDKFVDFYRENNMLPDMISNNDSHGLAELTNETVMTLVEYLTTNLQGIKIDQEVSFEILGGYCLTVRDLCWRISTDKDLKCHNSINKIDALCILTTAKVYQMLGYWSAKMEEKRKNRDGGGLARTELCKERITELARLIDSSSVPREKKMGTGIVGNEIKIGKAEFDDFCKRVLGVRADVSFPTKKKYLKGVEEILKKKVTIKK
jgi:hypothetical protein